MKSKAYIFVILGTILVTLLGCIAVGSLISDAATSQKDTTLVSLRSVSQQINAQGSVHSQQEATLHFQTGGKLVYLPFKEGDKVWQGQTIAQLDTASLQRELTAALNTYRSTRDTFDQTKDNSQNNVLFGQQRYSIEVFNKSGITTGDVENTIINDMVKRIVDQNQATLDNSVINVQLANDALQLASLTAPFTGVITSEDVTTPNVNVTAATSFTLADPTEKVFRAEVAASDIDFVSVGAKAIITFDGQNKNIAGAILTIYPQKKTLASGAQVYDVDIQAEGLSKNVAFGQNGSVLITSNNQTDALMVPSWAILGHTKIWVWENNHAVLKTIVTGSTHGNMTEVLQGLTSADMVMTQPESVIKKIYQLL